MSVVMGAYGQTGPRVPEGMTNVSYGYDYPNGLDLNPKSELSKKICREVYERARQSLNKMQNRHKSWNQIDRVLTAYVPLDVAEKKVKSLDPRKPVTIVVPYAYATLETLLTYLVISQLDGVIFPYDGRGPEDVVGANLLQLVIDQHVQRSKAQLNLHTMFRDALAYGVGSVACTWETQTAKKSIKQDTGFWSFLGNWRKTGIQRGSQESIVYEGNKLKNIDPYCYLPDPSVSVHDVQKGEFVGWVERTNLMDILSEEATNEQVFNAKYLKHCNARTSLIKEDQSKRTERFGLSDTSYRNTSAVNNPVDCVYMYIKLIPKDWGLGSGEYPEKWYFRVSGDCVVNEARPIGLNHNLFPLATAAPDFDGYSTTPVSRIEMVYGLQETLDWLFSSHIANVRKAINDMLIVDPYLINMDDLSNPEPGKLIRLRRAGWGKGVKDAVQQLQVNDITRANISDSSYIIELMNRCSASNDSLQGITRKSSERITATEIAGDRSNSVNRLERIAKVIQWQAMYDISFLFAAHTQQLMTQDTYAKIVGDWPTVLQDLENNDKRIKVSPFDLMVDYDIILKGGKEEGDAALWTQLYQVLAQNPLVGQQFDMVKIFKKIAILMGAKNVNDFVLNGGQVQPQMMNDQNVLNQAQAGNLVPMSDLPMGGMQ